MKGIDYVRYAHYLNRKIIARAKKSLKKLGKRYYRTLASSHNIPISSVYTFQHYFEV